MLPVATKTEQIHPTFTLFFFFFDIVFYHIDLKIGAFFTSTQFQASRRYGGRHK